MGDIYAAACSTALWLTGESEPQERTKDNDMENPLEASNVMFSSTLVVSGEAYGIVIRTGDSTVLGQIAHLTASEVGYQSVVVFCSSGVAVVASPPSHCEASTFEVDLPSRKMNNDEGKRGGESRC